MPAYSPYRIPSFFILFEDFYYISYFYFKNISVGKNIFYATFSGFAVLFHRAQEGGKTLGPVSCPH